MAKLPSGDPVPADGLIPTASAADSPFSVYLHIPFCTVRCGYCDFNTYTANELRGVTRQSFVDDLIAEINWSRDVLAASDVPAREAATVFIGGGTPSLLPAVDIARVLDAVREVHGIADGAEVTMEANPDTVTDDLVDGLVAAGVTRLSIGMQSAVPRILGILDRTYNPESVAAAVAVAKRAGLQTSVDLIYGTPTETIDEWRQSVDSAIALDTDHISAYALIVEEGTALERQIRRGEIPDIDDDLHADAYELVDDLLASAGFDWYEVSNWSRNTATRSRHNLAYWTDADWWGYGPGAHSHIAGTRWWNVKHPAAYAERVSAGVSPGLEREILTADQRHDEAVLLGSRLRDGLPVESLHAEERTRLAGLIAVELIDGAAAISGRVVLTRQGRLLADHVVRRILA
ncbi:MAG: radical SAM family heme chaperone HemW [Microbacteriaceae bacterium]